MYNEQQAAAKRFSIYHGLSTLEKWKFRHALRWISPDTESLQVLLDFERKLENRSLASWNIAEYLLNTSSWYNHETHGKDLSDPLPPNRLPEMLQIVIIFIRKSKRLAFEYRSLILEILQSVDSRGTHLIVAGYTPEKFRLQAAALIANLADRASGFNWDRYYPVFKMSADSLLRFSETIACKVSNPELFNQLQNMALKSLSHNGYVPGTIKLLEEIAGKVNDPHSVSEIFETVVPVIGLDATTSLMENAKDIHEFYTYYQRLTIQLKQWGDEYIYLFKKKLSAAELDHLLSFLELFPNQTRLRRYVLYAQTYRTAILYRYIPGALHAQKGYTFQALLQHPLKEQADIEIFIDSQIDQIERNIVDYYLNNLWHTTIKAQKVRFQFDTFTEYIPSSMRTWDWTVDNDKVRSYWNSTEGESREYKKYIDELEPRLVALLRKLDFSEFEVILILLPKYISVEEFTKTVAVPVEWKLDIEYQEGYNKWAGNYTEKVEVARPIRYINHDFKFDRPDLRNALGLLDSPEEISEVIQAYKYPHG